MATFTTTAGVLTFGLKLTNTEGWVSLFPAKKNMASKPIPFAFTVAGVVGSTEITQFLGMDSPKEKFTVVADDDSLAPALEVAWSQMLPGVLDLQAEFGTGFSYPGVYLTDVSAKRRRPWESQWELDVEFRQYV